MSIDILRNLPTKGPGLTALVSRVSESHANPPPRKTPRKEHNTSASQSTSSGSKDGPRTIAIPSLTNRQIPLSKTAELGTKVKRWMNEILTPDSPNATRSASYESVFLSCQMLVGTLGQGHRVYDDLRLAIERCVGEIAKPLLTPSAADFSWSRALLKAWEWISRRIITLRAVLVSLDRQFIPEHKDLLPITQLCYDIFSSKVFGTAKISNNLEADIKLWLKQERDKHSATPERAKLMEPIVSALQALGVYGTHFEGSYLDSTVQFYKDLCEQFAAGPATDYVDECFRRIEEEDERAKAVLAEPSRDEALNLTRQHLLIPKAQWLASEGLPTMMKSQDFAGLKRLYTLLRKVSALEPLRKSFQAWVQTEVGSVVSDTTRDEEMVARLIETKEYVESILTEKAFEERDTDIKLSFVDAYKFAFRVAFATRKNKPAEMIAKYVDVAMRRRDNKDQQKVNDQLKKALALHPFTPDKDVFRTFYYRAFAKRLLLNRSASDDEENKIIMKLKAYDPAFGDGEKMFADLRQSKDLATRFREKARRTPTDLALTCMVLQSSVWPIYIPVQKEEDKDGQTSVKVTPIDLPPEMQSALSNYEAFYKDERKTRRLQWVHALGTVTLTAHFPNETHELSVSLYQALVLLLFNDGDKLTTEDITAKTGLRGDELTRTLQSLVFGRSKGRKKDGFVLLKEPKGADIRPDDQFTYNKDFTDPRVKFHINSIQQAETEEENKRTTLAIDQDRQFHIDAAVVRIMKAKKTQTHNQLIAATTGAVVKHFTPLVADIKKQIDSLLSREYLSRDENSSNIYHYVA